MNQIQNKKCYLNQYTICDYLMQKIIDAEEKFFNDLLTNLLGREFDLEKDIGRFAIGKYEENDDILMFDGYSVGTIKREYQNSTYNITFIPNNKKYESNFN